MEITEKINVLPAKVKPAFLSLYQKNLISEETITMSLLAGELSGNTQHLLAFALAFSEMRRNHVPIADALRMAKEQNKKINLQWSAKRWKLEHDKLSHSAALKKLAGKNTLFDVSNIEKSLPSRFKGYLIRSSLRLGMEGFRQRHCVASYSQGIQSGQYAIAVVFVDKTRWTVQIFLEKDSDVATPRIVQIKGKYNCAPSPDKKKSIYKELNIELPNRSQSVDSVNEDKSIYEENLNRILPVLRSKKITDVYVSFDGCGDSGAIEEPTFTRSRDKKTGEIETVCVDKIFCLSLVNNRSWNGSTWVSNLSEKKVSLADAMHEVVNDYLEAANVDWYNNDGGFGSFKLNVQRGDCSISVYQRYTEESCEFFEERDIETWEEI